MAAAQKGNRSVKWSAAIKGGASEQSAAAAPATALTTRGKRGLAPQANKARGSITV